MRSKQNAATKTAHHNPIHLLGMLQYLILLHGVFSILLVLIPLPNLNSAGLLGVLSGIVFLGLLWFAVDQGKYQQVPVALAAWFWVLGTLGGLLSGGLASINFMSYASSALLMLAYCGNLWFGLLSIASMVALGSLYLLYTLTELPTFQMTTHGAFLQILYGLLVFIIVAYFSMRSVRERIEQTAAAFREATDIPILRESEEQLSTIFNESLDILVIIDADEHIQRINRTVYDILGYTPDELIGRHFSSLLPEVEEGEMPTSQTNGNALYNAVPFQRKNGTLCQMELTATVVPMRTGNAVLITLRDVSLREAMRVELEQSRRMRESIEQQRQLVEARQNMISVVAHQFKNPLAAIQLNAELLQRLHDRGMLNEKTIQLNVEKIIGNTQYLSHMMTTLFDVGDALRGNLEFKPVMTNLGQFVERVFNDLIETATDSNNQFVFENHLRTEQTLIDRNLLHHILDNLINNAIKYTPDDGRVRVAVRETSSHFTITISDEGIGIPAEDLNSIFTLFTRATNTGDIPGTGIGLALAHMSVRVHGGDLTVDSTVGKGSSFIITLPKKLPTA